MPKPQFPQDKLQKFDQLAKALAKLGHVLLLIAHDLDRQL
jgi:hypothetical protein